MGPLSASDALTAKAQALMIGVLQVQLAVYESTSLKDKRRVIKSLKDRLRHRFNVSVAETGGLESRQAAEVTAAMVANESRFLESSLQSVLNFIERHQGASLVDYHMEML